MAYAGLADACTTASDWVLSPREALPKAEAAARRALEFDDGLAEAHSALAHAQLHEWKLADAGKEFTRALALNPNITSIYFGYAEYLSALGRQDQASAEIRKALKIDPLSAEILFLQGFPLYLKHDYEGDLAADRAAIKAHPDFWAPHHGERIRLSGRAPISRGHRRIRKGSRVGSGRHHQSVGSGRGPGAIGIARKP